MFHGDRGVVVGRVAAFLLFAASSVRALTLTNSPEVSAASGGTYGRLPGAGGEIVFTNRTDSKTFWWADKNGDNTMQAVSSNLDLAGYSILREKDRTGIILNLFDGSANNVVTNGGRISTQHADQNGAIGSVIITNAVGVYLSAIDVRNTYSAFGAGAIQLFVTGDAVITSLLSTASGASGGVLVQQQGSLTVGVLSNNVNGNNAPGAIAITGGGTNAGTCTIGTVNQTGGNVNDVTIRDYRAVRIPGGIDARDIVNSGNIHGPGNVIVCNVGTGGVVMGSILSGSIYPNVTSARNASQGIVLTNIAGNVVVGNIDTHSADWSTASGNNNLVSPIRIVVAGSVQAGNLTTYYGSTAYDRNGGDIAVTSLASSVSVGSLDTRTVRTSATARAGNVSLTAFGDLSVTGSVITLAAGNGGAQRGTLALTTSAGSGGRISVGSQTTDVFNLNLVQYAAFNSDCGTNFLSGIVSNFNITSTNGNGTLASPFSTTQTTLRAASGQRIYYKGDDDSMNAYLSNAVYRVADLAGVKGAGGLLLVLPPDLAIATLYATNVTAAAADLVGNLTTGAAPVEVTCYWGTNDGGRVAAAWGANAYLGTNALGLVTNAIAGGLTGGTLYYFRFYASNAVTNVWSPRSAVFSTLGVPQVDDGNGALVTETSATLRGNLTVGNPQPSVWIYWGTTDGGTNKGDWNRSPLSLGQPQPIPAAFSTNVFGLLPAHTYWYRCYASNASSEAWAPASTTFTTATATLTIADASVAEGASGGPASQAVFAFTLSNTNDVAVSVDYATADGTAVAGTDYQATAGTLTIPAGSLTGQVSVSIIGNDLFNPNTTFQLALSNAVNAVLVRTQAVCTIANDDFSLYVRLDGSDANNGGSWNTAFQTLQRAMNVISNSMAATATVWVAKTTTGAYAGASKIFNHTTNLNIQILGGYNPANGLRDGVSEIVTNGIGLDIGPAMAGSGTNNVANILLSDFRITAGSYGLHLPVDSTLNNCAVVLVSNSVIASTSATVPAIHLGLNGSGGQVNFLTLDHCTVSTPASNAGAAVYFPQTGNYTPPGLLELRNGSVVQAFAGPGAAAIFAYCARFVIDNSTVTNSGFGLAVSGGSGMYLSTGHEIRNSTISSDGAGIELRSASYGATGVVVESATIVARGTNATALYVQVDSASALSDLLVTNAVLLATNNGGTGILITRGFGGSSFDTLIVDSKVHGRERACLHTGGNSNNDSRDNLRTLRAVFSAGDTNSSVNSASPVVQLSPWASYSVFLERTLIRNGLGGLLVTNISGSYGSSVSLVNVVITDQAQYGVRLRTTGTTDESVLATNCTFSNLGGPVVAYGDNGAGNRYGTFAFCAFAPGAGGGNAAATNLVSEGTAGMLTLSGFTNGLYAYGALTNTLAAVNAAGFSGNVLAPSGDPLLAADGYHLQNGSPLIDVYTLVAGCPTNDIDGRLRPVHARADLGAVEFVSAPGTSILFR